MHQAEALRIPSCKQGQVKFNPKPDRHVSIAFVCQLIFGCYGSGGIIKGKALFDTHGQLGIILMQHAIAGKGEPDRRCAGIFFQARQGVGSSYKISKLHITGLAETVRCGCFCQKMINK